MKNKNHRILWLSILFLNMVFSVSHAEMVGQIHTKRERAALQRPSRGPSPSAFSAQIAYQDIHESFLRGNYSRVDILAERYLSQTPGAADANDALHLQALSLLKLNRSDEARQKFQQLEGSATNREIKAAASASIGDAYYYEGNHVRAYDSYKETVKKYPVSEQKDYLRARLLELSSEFGYTLVPNSPKNLAPTSHLQQMSFEEMPFYTVQVGSFSKPKNANELVKKLARQGYDAYVTDDKSHGMNRVRVGRFSSKQEASRTEMRLNREGYPTKIVP